MGLDRDQFEDLMLSDPKTFSNFARTYMDSKDVHHSFLDWCWEKYLAGAQPEVNACDQRLGQAGPRFTDLTPFTNFIFELLSTGR